MKEVVAFLKATNTKGDETDTLHTTRTTNPTTLYQQNSENHGTKVEERVDQLQLRISAPAYIPTAPAHIPTAPAHIQTTPTQINRREGGRLHHFWRVWQELGVKGEVINILRDGLKWTFTEALTMSQTPWNAQKHSPRKGNKYDNCYSNSTSQRCHREGTKHKFTRSLLHTIPEKEDFRRTPTYHRPKRIEQNHSELHLQNGIFKKYSKCNEEISVGPP